MSDRNLQVRVGVNLGNSASQLKALNQNLKNTESSFKKAGAGIENFESTAKGSKAKVEMLSKSIETQTSKLNILKQQYKDTESKMKTVSSAYDKQRTKVQQLESALEKAKDEYGKNSKEAKELASKLNDSKKALERKEKAVVSCDNKLVSLSTQINNAEADIKSLNKQLDGTKWSSYSQQLEQTASKLKNVGSKISSAGKNVSIAGAAITGVFSKMVSVSIDFEKAMSQVQATSGASAEDMKSLSDEAERLGKEIRGADLVEVAESYNYLALAGYDTNDMLASMESTVKANIAFNGDMATTADLLTDSLSALGKSAEYSEEYLNIIAQTSRNANTSGTQLMEAYIECGATLANMKVPVKESAKILAVMADNGLKGSEAGRSLQSVMVNLMGTTSTTAGALKKLGVEAYDSEGNFKGLEKVLGEVCGSASKMTDEQSDMTLAALGGKTQLTALNNMLKATGGSYDELEEAINNSDGALEEMYQTMSNNTAGTWADVQGKVSSMAKTFGDILLPYVEAAIKKLGVLVQWLAGLDKNIQKIIVAVGAFIVVLGPALLLLGGMVSSIGGIVGAFSALTGAIGAAGSVGAFFTASLLPVIGIVAGIIAVVALLAGGIRANFDNIKKAVEVLKQSFELNMGPLKESFSGLWQTCQSIYETVIQPLFQTMGQLIEATILFIADCMPGISAAFQLVCDILSSVWESVGAPVFGFLVDVIQMVVDFVVAHLPEISRVFNGVMAGIKQGWESVGKPLFQVLKAVISGTIEAVKPIIQSLLACCSKVFSAIVSIWENLLKPVFDGLIFIVGKVIGVVKPHMETFKKCVKGAMEFVMKPIQKVSDLIGGLFDGIGKLTSKAGGFISKVFGKSRSISLDTTSNGTTDTSGISTFSMARAVEPLNNVALSGQYYNASSIRSAEVDNVIRAANGMYDTSNSSNEIDLSGLGNIIANAIQESIGNMNINVNSLIDGKVVAKTTAKYMNQEIETLNKRSTRLGGAF